jgi:chromosomal replication initiation ATPase DnaA
MKRYSFGTFEVEDSNRQAYEVCLAVADRKKVSPYPVLVLGGEARGKTHLLYSIVNHVRASSAKTGLAYVTAHDFPDQVRALIKNPAPVQRAQAAILLVDQLELFTELVDELEAVVRLFIDNNHAVVLATSVHPSRLKNLNEGLLSVINAGQIAEIQAKAAEGADGEQNALIQKQEAELRQLRERLAELESQASAGASAEELAAAAKAENEALHKRIASIEEDARSDRARVKTLGDERTAMESDLKRLRGELEELQTQSKAAEANSGEADALRQQKAAAEREIGELRYQVEALEA